MKLDKQFCMKSLEDLGFQKLETEYGTFIKLPLFDALRFSMIVGSSFINNSVGTTLKGRSEVFIHRAIFKLNSLTYSPGLFGRNIEGYLAEGNSFLQLNKKFPEIFRGDFKYILVKEIGKDERSNVEESLFLHFRKLFEDNSDKEYLNPNNIILFKLYPKGTNLEPFFEYLVSIYFNRKGFVTENQVPWFQQKYNLKGKMINGGIPDFSAFKFSFLSLLAKEGLFSEGMPIEEFGLLFLKQQGKGNNEDYNYEFKLGEAKISKSSKPQILKQLTQYNEAGLANELFGIIPDEINGFENFGLINFNEGLEYVSKTVSDLDDDLRNKDDLWIKIYVKAILLSNLCINEVIKIIKEHVNKTEVKSEDLLTFLIESNDEEFVKLIKNGIYK
jgi:hypothetical protein